MTQIEFNHMVNSHSLSLRVHAMNFTKDLEDANDLVQDTMVKAIRFYKNFQEGTNFKGWLFVIMKNTFINNYRKNVKAKSIVTQEEDISSENLLYSSEKNACVGKMIIDDVQKALSVIPDAYSVPFIKYFEGYKYHEIADHLKIPLGTVKTRIHVAREMLKKYLKTYSLKEA